MCLAEKPIQKEKYKYVCIRKLIQGFGMPAAQRRKVLFKQRIIEQRYFDIATSSKRKTSFALCFVNGTNEIKSGVFKRRPCIALLSV